MIEGLGNVYKVRGFYQFGGRDNYFTGQFSIDSSGRIIGKIWDPNSICSEHEVKGEVKEGQGQSDGVTTLEFVKIPTGILANIYYQLQKVSDPKHKLTGAYNGTWNFRERVLSIMKGAEGEIVNQTHIELE